MNGCLKDEILFGINSASLGFSSEFLGVKSETSYLCINCYRKEHDNCNLPDCICECNKDPLVEYHSSNEKFFPK